MPPANRILILQITRSAASDAVLSLPTEAAARGKAVPTAGPVAAGPWPPGVLCSCTALQPHGPRGGKAFPPDPYGEQPVGGCGVALTPPSHHLHCPEAPERAAVQRGAASQMGAEATMHKSFPRSYYNVLLINGSG